MAKVKNTMSNIFIKIVSFFFRCYRVLISPLLGNRCRFYPSCSIYFEESVKNQGVLKGFILGFNRLLKCHPFHQGGFDPPIPVKIITKKLKEDSHGL